MSINVRIALQLSEIDSDYAQEIVRGVSDLCQERGGRLTVYTGNSPGWPYGHGYQNTAIFSHITPVNADALVLASGTQCNYVSPEEFDAHVRSLSPMPVVSFGVPIPGIPSILIDNRNAFRTLLDHLADVHGYRKFAFVSGPKNNGEARERKAAFLAFLEDRAIPASPLCELCGDFSVESGYRAMEQYFGHHRPDCEAIACANDNMALGVYRYLREAGAVPGRDVAVIGFDDIARARFEAPPLTTVRQDVYRQAYIAAGYAMDALEGKRVPLETRMAAEPVVRSSCGCLSGTISGLIAQSAEELALPGLAEYRTRIRLALAGFFAGNPMDLPRFAREIHELIEGAPSDMRDPRHWNNVLNDLFREFLPAAGDQGFSERMHIAFQSARSLVSELFYANAGLERYRMSDELYRIQEHFSKLNTVMPLDELLPSLRKIFSDLGVNSAHLVLFERRLTRLRNEPFRLPETAESALRFGKGAAGRVDGQWLRFNPREAMLPGPAPDETAPFAIAHSLYHQFDQLGYLVFEPGGFGLENVEFLCSLISNALEASLLFTEKLELENRLGRVRTDRLRTASRGYDEYRDAFTGLYNKRGFAAFSGEISDIARRMRRGGVLLFVALEGLNEARERFGEESGERAVRETARMLKAAFRNLDVVGRIEADLFGVLAVDTDECRPETLESRVYSLAVAWNERANAPFTLTLSVGAAEMPADGEFRLEDLFAEASRALAARRSDT